jgi:4-amino-4-deoxy-L-arabinose transferase-like glycosyltransferase
MQVQKWLATHQQQVVAILLVGLVWRSLVAFWLHPGFDEVYYYIYTLHPNWSYFDHPPLVALTTGLGVWLTGEVSQFTIRLGSVLLYTGTLWLLYFTSAHLFSTGVGVMAVAIASIVPIFQVGFGILTIPDVPLMFFWMAALWVAAQEFFPRHQPYRPTYRLALIGALVGFACLGKYHGVLLGAGLFAFCLTSEPHRQALRSPWMGLSLGLFLLVFSPVILWNWQQDWVSFRYQGNRGIPMTGYRWLGVWETLLVGIAYLFPSFGFVYWGATVKTIGQQWRQRVKGTPFPQYHLKGDRLIPIPPSSPQPSLDRQRRQRLLLWVAVPAFLSFTLIGGYQQVLPTWPMPGFFTATPLVAYYAAIVYQRHAPWVRRWLVGSAITVFTLLLVALLQITAGIFQQGGTYALGGGVWPSHKDPTVQMVDVQQLRQGLARSPQLMAGLQSAGFVFSNRFYLAGQVGMAIAPLTKRPITSLDGDLRGFAFWSRPSQWIGQNGIYITSDRFVNRENISVDYAPYFKQFTKLGEVPIRRGGKVIESFHIYQGKQMLKPFPRPYGLQD